MNDAVGNARERITQISYQVSNVNLVGHDSSLVRS